MPAGGAARRVRAFNSCRDGRGLLHRSLPAGLLAASKQRRGGGVLLLRFSLHGDPGRGDLERRWGEGERMKDESGRMNRQM